MDEKDKNKIGNTLPYLISGTKNVEHLINLLIEKRVFNNFMVNKIKSHEGVVDKLYCLYEMIPKRGPEAFKKLTDALHESGNRDLALRLKSNRCINNHPDDFNSALQGDGLCGSKENGLDGQQSHNSDWLVKQKERYPMTTLPRGHWLIVNIEEFDDNVQERRAGSLENVRKLKELGEFFGFEVSLGLDIDAQTFEKFIIDFCQDGQPKNAVILIVMSHGQQQKMLSANRLQPFAVEVIAKDNQTVSSDWIIDQFSALNCRTLASKPKIIMFITCSGEDLFQDLAIEADGEKYVTHAINSDLITVFSLLPGCQPRENQMTKFVIDELVSVLGSRWKRNDVVSMLQEVNRNLKSKINIIQTYLDVKVSLIGFDKKFFFNPVTDEERLILEM